MTLVRKGISRVHELEGGKCSKHLSYARGLEEEQVFQRSWRVWSAGKVAAPRMTGSGGGDAQASAGAALPPTPLPSSTLPRGLWSRCHGYRHSLERRGRALAYVIPSATLAPRLPPLSGVRAPRPASQALHLRALPPPVPSRGSAPARFPPGRAKLKKKKKYFQGKSKVWVHPRKENYLWNKNV